MKKSKAKQKGMASIAYSWDEPPFGNKLRIGESIRFGTSSQIPTIDKWLIKPLLLLPKYYADEAINSDCP